MFTNELWNKPPAGATGFYEYQIAHSLRFPTGANGYLSNTSLSAGNRRTWTYSIWTKKNWINNTTNGERSWLSGYSTGGATYVFWGFQGHSSNTAHMDDFKFEETSGSTQSAFSIDGTPERKFRDPSAWYHVVLAIDTTQSTATNRQKLWINGEAQTLAVSTQMAQDYEFSFVNNGTAKISHLAWSNGLEDTQLADYIFLDGVAGTADTFGEFHNGVWRPVEYSGSYGDEGYHLKFEDSSNLGNDSSGNNNDFSVTNLSAHDQTSDSPTNNFCTINPVFRGTETSDAKYGTLSEGNLKLSYTSNSDAYQCCTHKVPASGKWYWEYAIIAGGGSTNFNPAFGIFDPNGEAYASGDGGNKGFVDSIVYNNADNNVYKARSSTKAYDGSRGSDGDVMGVALDMDNGAIYFSKNGTWYSSGDPTSGSSRTNAGATWTPASEFTAGAVPLACCGGGSTPQIVANFGQEGTFGGTETAGGNSDTNGYGNFYSTVPSGYSAICTGALSVAEEIDPAETDDNYPSKLFNAIAYSGDGGGSQTTGFQPDLVWVKRRDGDQSNGLWDSSRGTTKVLNSDGTSAEGTSSGLTAFGSTGYTMGTYYNQSGNTYVSWAWRAYGGTTSSETAGSINTTVQVNQNAGFSIVQYVGDGGSSNCTMVHGLGAKPAMVFLKDRDSNGNNNSWQAWHHKLDTNGYFYLNSNDEQYTSTNGTVNVSANTTNLIGWQRTSTTGGSQTITESGDNYVMYIWAEIEGFSKFGSYVGNGDTDGTFVYTGFRPALVTIKRTDSSGSWHVYDDARDTYNPADTYLLWDTTGSDDTASSNAISLLSNGFKLRNTAAGLNGSGNDYVYAAWAHNSFKYATAR